jgi:hypothetical protein
MDDLFRLIGIVLPDTPTLLRIKVLVAGGLGGLAAGITYMMTGLEGSLVRGALIATCGILMIAITVRSFHREAQKRAADEILARERRESDARRKQERLARQMACDEHNWLFDDKSMEYGIYVKICTKCGAYKVVEDNADLTYHSLR